MVSRKIGVGRPQISLEEKKGTDGLTGALQARRLHEAKAQGITIHKLNRMVYHGILMPWTVNVLELRHKRRSLNKKHYNIMQVSYPN